MNLRDRLSSMSKLRLVFYKNYVLINFKNYKERIYITTQAKKTYLKKIPSMLSKKQKQKLSPIPL